MSSPDLNGAKYVIGIDLGTTHSVLSFRDITEQSAESEIFMVDQLIAPGEVARKPLLPSFRYHFATDELNPIDHTLPWLNYPFPGELDRVIIGHWARDLGSKTKGRLVSSAKSWLSHPNVDVTADILPWGSEEEIPKVSPLVASASYLNHFQQSWNYHNPDHPLKDQCVVITVPASFTESARALTIGAAKLVGLENIQLLEEPQAVCYDWYNRNQQSTTDEITTDKTMLVCDVGGGTTDLSLIDIKFKNCELSLNRIAVGEHLMLGGDNIDLALAHSVEKELSPENRLKTGALGQLIQQTRAAKELFLSENPPEKTSITLLGRGTRLIGNAKTCELTRQHVLDTVFNGFIPLSEFYDLPTHRRSAIVEFGLPYTSDPAISKHIAEFIHRYYGLDLAGSSDDYRDKIPTAILVNGGIFNSVQIKQQIEDLISHWKQQEIQMLSNGNPDLSVAYGAVEFGLARLGRQMQIGGGAARNYFLELVDNSGQEQAICLLPKGTAEEQEIHLSSRLFSLTIGEPIRFNLSTTNSELAIKAGDVITSPIPGATPLPPFIVTVSGDETQKRYESVYLTAKLTTIGTIQLACASQANKNKRWALEFAVRHAGQNEAASSASEINPRLPDAINLIATVFGPSSKKTDPKRVKTLRTDLDRCLGKRDNWDTALLRELSVPCLQFAKNRRRTEQHERNWLKLTSYLLRPGFGYPADEWRLEQIWPLYKNAIQYNKTTPSWSDWWNFWRRIAGGLSADQQAVLYQDLSVYFVADTNKNAKLINQAKSRSYEDIIRLAASLEHISVADKIRFIEFLFDKLKKPQNQQVHWWAIGRVASRVAYYGSQHNIIPAPQAEVWIDATLHKDWQKEPHIAFACVMMARKTGDRNSDISAQLAEQIVNKLTKSKVPESWIKLVEEVQKVDEAMTKRIFGESLPTGLTLLH